MPDAHPEGRSYPGRTAWVEINLVQLRENFRLLFADKPQALKILSVVKDQAYGHGAVTVAREAITAGATHLATCNVAEASELREAGIVHPILVFGEFCDEDLRACVELGLTCSVNSPDTAKRLSEFAGHAGKKPTAHVKIQTGMSRYGVNWDQCTVFASSVQNYTNIQWEGIFTHFAMSDETDKSFANEQLKRYEHAIATLAENNFHAPLLHTCNTGGFLDLPQAHKDMVRIGILPLGVYPSKVCRRIPGIAPVMSVKTRIAATRTLAAGDNVGYGLRYSAPGRERIAVLPIGYGDGYPRVRNEGHVLIHGRPAPIIGGNAMDATMVNIAHVPEALQWDEVVLMGSQGNEDISVHDLATLKKTVSYEVLTNWRSRLPRVHV